MYICSLHSPPLQTWRQKKVLELGTRGTGKPGMLSQGAEAGSSRAGVGTQGVCARAHNHHRTLLPCRYPASSFLIRCWTISPCPRSFSRLLLLSFLAAVSLVLAHSFSWKPSSLPLPPAFHSTSDRRLSPASTLSLTLPRWPYQSTLRQHLHG